MITDRNQPIEAQPMNEQLQLFARETLKDGLSRLSESHRLMFRRMYSHDDLEKDINEVVDDMPEDRLDWAMLQVQRSLDIKAKAQGDCLEKTS